MTPYQVIATGFAVVFGAMMVVELLARAGRGGCRSVREALDAALRGGIGRWRSAGLWLTMLGWLWVGFHFLAR